MKTRYYTIKLDMFPAFSHPYELDNGKLELNRGLIPRIAWSHQHRWLLSQFVQNGMLGNFLVTSYHHGNNKGGYWK